MGLTEILSTPAATSQVSTESAAIVDAAAQTGVTTQTSWTDSLPEAYRADANITAHSGLESLLADYNALKLTGGQFKVPAIDSKYEDHKDFYTQLGVPESPDKYEIPIPDGAQVNQEFLSEVQKIAHQYKVPAAALKALAEADFKFSSTALEQQAMASQQELENRSKTLEAKWGAEKDARVEFTKNSYQQFADSDTAAALKAKGIDSDPDFLHLMSEIGKAMKLPLSPGQKSSSGSGVQTQLVTTPEQAQEAIKAVQMDPVKMKAFMDPKDPQHKLINAHMDELYQKAYPR